MAAPSSQILHQTLKEHFGYDSFRPLQEEIVRTTMEGRDVLALLPTGGGKSLCFQLPSLHSKRMTLVVSPLIALMKDQVDQLLAAGISATFLNSTLEARESRHRIQGLESGQYRLLYAAPERIMMPGFLDDLKRWDVERIAIDEAHCISEWGHDFRPEYRQLPTLRKVLTQVPIIALTATATDQVRDDIEKYLELKNPARFTASFNRPNLTYRVVPKQGPYHQLLEFLKARPDDSGIVYCQSRKTTEQVAERLSADGIPAVPYHAGLDHGARSANQDKFLRDRVRVVCATIAFGMGINKPNVRFVVHYDLPKNLEGYYQETGRAGRDGLPGECVLLYSSGDVAKIMNFISEVPDPAEAARQRHLLDQVVHYAEVSDCRRRVLLDYFSEKFPDPNCGACDNCLSPRENFDGTEAAQKLMSCVFRANSSSRWQFGLGHYCDILCGANTEAIRKREHITLSTYGIGKELKKTQWQVIGRELIRMGFLHADPTRMGSISITPAGLTALKSRTKIMLAVPLPVVEKRSAAPQQGEIPCDEGLFQKLRQVRRELAEARAVPPYVIFGDVTLRHLARTYPQTADQCLRVPGVGQQKLRDFGEAFMEVIREHLRNAAPQNFSPLKAEVKPVPAPITAKNTANDTASESLRIFRLGPPSIQAVAEIRGLSESTIVRHLADAIIARRADDLAVSDFIAPAEAAELNELFNFAGQLDKLGPIKEMAGDKFSWNQLHLFRAFRMIGKI